MYEFLQSFFPVILTRVPIYPTSRAIVYTRIYLHARAERAAERCVEFHSSDTGEDGGDLEQSEKEELGECAGGMS